MTAPSIPRKTVEEIVFVGGFMHGETRNVTVTNPPQDEIRFLKMDKPLRNWGRWEPITITTTTHVYRRTGLHEFSYCPDA